MRSWPPPNGVRVRELRLGRGRERVRFTAASHGFNMVRRWLSDLPNRDAGI